MVLSGGTETEEIPKPCKSSDGKLNRGNYIFIQVYKTQQHENNLFFYSQNQKTVEQEDDTKKIQKGFNKAQQIILLMTS